MLESSLHLDYGSCGAIKVKQALYYKDCTLPPLLHSTHAVTPKTAALKYCCCYCQVILLLPLEKKKRKKNEIMKTGTSIRPLLL